MEIEAEEDTSFQQRRDEAAAATKAAQMAAWMVEAREGQLPLSEDALSFAMAEWRITGATQSARICVVLVMTHISLDRDMMRLPISEVSAMTAERHEHHIRTTIIDPLVKYARKNEAAVDALVIRNDDRKAGLLEAAKQLTPHQVFVTAKPSMFGKRSAIAIIDALSGPCFAAYLPDNACLVALQGKKILKALTVGSPGSSGASPNVEFPPSASGGSNDSSSTSRRGRRLPPKGGGGLSGVEADGSSLIAPPTPPRGVFAPAGSGKGSPLSLHASAGAAAAGAASAGAAAAGASATSSVSGSVSLSSKLTSFWRTSSQEIPLSGSPTTPSHTSLRSKSVSGSFPCSPSADSDCARSFNRQQQRRPLSSAYNGDKVYDRSSRGSSGLKPGSVVTGQENGQEGLEVTIVGSETLHSRVRRRSLDEPAGGGETASARDVFYQQGNGGSNGGSRSSSRSSNKPAVPSHPGCMLLDSASVAAATGNFCDRLCLTPRHPLLRVYAGYMGGVHIVAAQMNGPDWLPGLADLDLGQGSAGSSRFESAVRGSVATLQHETLCPLLGCCPTLRCIVYHRPPGSCSLATRLACCGASSGARVMTRAYTTSAGGEPMSRASSSGSLVHRSSSTGSFNSPDSSTSDAGGNGTNTSGSSGGNGGSGGSGGSSSNTGESNGVTLTDIDSRSMGDGSLRPLSWQARLKIVTQTCRVLTWLHQQSPPVAAGWLTVETVFLTGDDSCRLLLAGVAGLAADPRKMAQKLNREMSVGERSYLSGGGEGKGREWHAVESGMGASAATAEAGDVFAFGLLILHVLTGWVESGAVRQLLTACWAAADIHRAVEVVVRAARQSCQAQPCCDWPDELLHSLAMVALECAEECEEWRPVLVGCVLDQVLEMEAEMQRGIISF